MRKHNLITTFCLLISIQYSFAQSISDSLSKVLDKKDLPVEERIMTMGLLSRSLTLSDTTRAMKISQQMLQLSRTLKDPKYMVYAFGALAPAYQQQDNLEKAKQATDSVMWYANKTTDRQAKGFAWYIKAWQQGTQDQNKDAIKSCIKALTYLEGSNPSYYEVSIYNIMSGTYAEWHDFPASRKYAQLCITKAREINDYDYIIDGMRAMATYYHYSFKDNDKDSSLLDSALSYNRNAITLYFQHRDRVIFHNTMAILAVNTAGLYQEHFPAAYKDSVLRYLNIGLKIGLETRFEEVIAVCYGMMSEYAITEGNYKKAEELLRKGLAVTRSGSNKNTSTTIQFMQMLANVAEKEGDFAKALKYYKEYHETDHELFDAEKLAIAKRLEAQYQTEKNEAALKALIKTASLTKKLNYLYIFLVVAAVTALIFLLLFFRIRLKSTLQQQKLLEKDKEDAELHARLKEEEAMRSIAEQQLLLERQERLQKDLLAGSLQVEQKDELLQAVQKKIEENKGESSVLKQINHIIDQSKRIDDNIGAYKADFDNIHPEFFEKLKEKSDNTLSRLDLKHCSYISIGLTNKEIAQRLGIAPKSILMARYRIKLKLGLGKDIDLDDYIRTL
ncbi:regulatory protein, luxR family [Chitinophaga sp. CF118]|uniref:tetratricopeptide repeat protein n=1 Tax=Chitinophaga sp. CF118 TaxID=1884367 RepID=UPI0008EFE5FC|nr:LuxR C-terminal-related transcriptional regulator [Chitinophaga sp. CF118]SFD87859.1 regulatory protein, luxR family [Chitinophaga sp. CF118]